MDMDRFVEKKPRLEVETNFSQAENVSEVSDYSGQLSTLHMDGRSESNEKMTCMFIRMT
jgi:hypothetical protein